MCPSITDWIMIGVTIAYVVATIFIFRANKKSAKAAEDQLAEMKRQFEETKRLDALPFLQLDISTSGNDKIKVELPLISDDTNGGVNPLALEVKNIGRGTAKDIKYEWTNLSGYKTEKEWFPIMSLYFGDRKELMFTFFSPKVEPENNTAILNFYYSDLLENMYIQKVEFFFQKGSLFSTVYKSHTTFPPVYIGKSPNPTALEQQ